MKFFQEKYIVMLDNSILTRGGFKRCKDSVDIKHCEIRLFNSVSSAETYVEPRYRQGYVIKKVIVNLEIEDKIEE